MTWREHALAVLVLFHASAVAVSSLPSTRGLLYRPAWKAPSVQDELAAWAETLSAFGPAWTGPELEDTLWDVATTVADVHELLLAPFQPYYTYCGVRQSRQMFPAPERHPARLHADVLEGGVWRNVYVGRSDTADWNRSFFDQDRIRTMTYLYGWPHMRKLVPDLVTYLAPKAREDFPEATELRVRFWRYRTASPEEAAAGRIPEGAFEPGASVRLR
ncbi:MAG: hypothetical protein KC656_24625 [Myxococcales bacterium]|nr:hypothetical protein [Myxococcales bacterium]